MSSSDDVDAELAEGVANGSDSIQLRVSFMEGPLLVSSGFEFMGGLPPVRRGPSWSPV